MHRAALLGLLLGTAVLAAHAADGTSLPEQYLTIYLKINEGEKLEKAQDDKGALATFEECYRSLLAIQQTDPDWEACLVDHRINDAKAKILDLEAKSHVPLDFTFAPKPLPPHLNYPWKANVATTLFWIGKNGVKSSAWNPDWLRDNDGPDSPDARNGYSAAAHASGVNPFYVALPFNDLAHQDEARTLLPAGWHRDPKNGPPVSSCKDRWVEIKNARGDDCFAQWEDTGPGKDDRADYIFGGESIGKDTPGIALSPAVRDYLGLGGGPTDAVSWRFVDKENVRPGAWLKLDEQAIIYTALHHLQASR